jgi:hypothetical protein
MISNLLLPPPLLLWAAYPGESAINFPFWFRDCLSQGNKKGNCTGAEVRRTVPN